MTTPSQSFPDLPEASQAEAITYGMKDGLPFPPRILDLLKFVAERNPPEGFGPYEDSNGEPLQDDADAALRWLSDAQALAGEVERLRADSVRLDWIVRQADEFSCGLIVDAPGDGDYIVHGMDGYGQGKTAREAIDNAMRFNGAALDTSRALAQKEEKS